MRKNYLKKIFVAVVILLCSVAANAYHITIHGIDYFVDTISMEAWVVDNNSMYSGVVNIPSTIFHDGNTYKVTKINDGAFYGCTGLTNIVIPESVRMIGTAAFFGCTNLSNVTIPEGVTSIGTSAFRDCSSITDIVIPESVTSIEDYFLYGCTSLSSVTINSNADIKSNSFGNCTSITKIKLNSSIISSWFNDYTSIQEVVLGDSVTEIDNAFYGCTGLKKITLGNGVKEIVGCSFEGCTGLTSVTIPNSVTTIRHTAFRGCTALEELHIEDGNSKLLIGPDDDPFYVVCFSNCPIKRLYLGRSIDIIRGLACPFGNKINSLTISDSVTSIGEGAFYGCTDLTSVTIPESVTSIGEGAFDGCGIKSATILSNSLDVSYLFEGCMNIERLELNCYTIRRMWRLDITSPKSLLKEVVLGDSVKCIDSDAFALCKHLKSVTIPAGVTKIDMSAFNYCDSLISIVVDKENKVYDSRDNCNAIIETATNTLIIGCNTTVIPNSITKIGAYAFVVRKNLTSITIPNSVKSIDWYAFYGCTGLTSVTIPESVTSIGSYAFDGCTGLSEVHISSLSAWCKIDFASYGYMLHNGASLYLNGEEIIDLVIPEDVTEIKFNAFFGGNFNSVTIPNSVTSIGNSAFCNCIGLTSVTIPNSVTSIGNSAFYGCTGLTSVTIPESVTSIGSYAFDGCIGLTSVTIPNSVTSIGNSAFNNCTGLTSVTIPEGVTSIGNSAFNGCIGLTNVIIPKSVTSIGNSAFNGCGRVINFSNVRLNSSAANKVINAPNGSSIEGDFIFGEIENVNALCGYIGNDVIISLPNNYDGGNYIIGEYAFSEYTSLTSITIPEGVTSIGSNAFYNCTGLSSITITEGVTSIGSNAFYNCTGLSSITIPKSVTSIGKSAFNGRSNIVSVYSLNETPAKIQSSSFYSKCYTNATLYVPQGSLEAYKTADGWKKFENIVEFDPTGIEDVTKDDALAFEVTAGGIQLADAKGKAVGVYNAGGALVEKIDNYAGEEITLDKGIYILCVGDKVAKVKL